MFKPLARMRALLFTLLIACGDSSDLDDHQFILQSAQGFPLVAGSSMILVFDGDSLSVSAGCNSLGGAYHISGGRLVIKALSATERGCALALMMQDEQLATFLRASPRLMRSGDQLVLSSETVILRFLDRELADPDRPLVDTIWAIDTLIDEQSFGSSPTSVNPLVQFAGDGTVHIQSTCNAAAGRYAVDRNRLTLSRVVYTEQGCDDPVAAGLEQKVKSVLYSGTLTFEIEARRLTLMRDRVGLSAQAQVVQVGPDAGGP